MKTATLINRGNAQSVRLPEGFHFGGNEVFIKKSGNAVILLPKKNSWQTLISSLDKFTPDFMAELSCDLSSEKERTGDWKVS